MGNSLVFALTFDVYKQNADVYLILTNIRSTCMFIYSYTSQTTTQLQQKRKKINTRAKGLHLGKRESFLRLQISTLHVSQNFVP
jgi:hypothetical protein